MKIIITILTLGLIFNMSFAQEVLHCDSLTTPNFNIHLTPMQDSVLFSYSNIASDSIYFSQNYYVSQWVSISDHSIVDTIINTLQWSSGFGLPTYVSPSQIYKLVINYTGSSIPHNYSLQCYYNILETSSGNTCQIPFTLNFETTTSIITFNEKRVNIYPNPINDFTVISLLPTNSEISIFDFSGRLISKYYSTEKEKRLNLSNLNIACYMMVIRDRDDGKIIDYRKIIKL